LLQRIDSPTNRSSERATVAWFDDVAGFGYLKLTNGDLVHVKFESIEGTGLRTLVIGEQVTLWRDSVESAKLVVPDVPRPYPWTRPTWWILRTIFKKLHDRGAVRYMWTTTGKSPAVNMIRYYIYHGQWGEIYFYQFLNDDLDLFHDHPWSFVSILLSGAYEVMDLDSSQTKRRASPSVAYVSRRTRHRVVVPEAERGRTVSLAVTFGKRKEWYFYSGKDDVGTSPDDFAAKSNYSLQTYTSLAPPRGLIPTIDGGTVAPTRREVDKC
jgi:cold shock CspA family protein